MEKSQVIADAILQEDRDIRHHFSDTELANLREDCINNDFVIADKKAELKAYVKQAKDELKKLQAISDEKRQLIRDKFIDQRTFVHGVPDFGSGMMQFFTEDGELVDTRKLRPIEREQKLPFNNV